MKEDIGMKQNVKKSYHSSYKEKFETLWYPSFVIIYMFSARKAVHGTIRNKKFD